MQSDLPCLGICYAGNHLYYSVNSPDDGNHLKHIGSIDFSFDVQHAINTGSPSGFPALKTALENLKDTFQCGSVKILSPAIDECWTIVPRSVYEDSAEREAHISLLMHGQSRSDVETIWHSTSNIDYKMLLLRNSESMQGFNQLLGNFPHSEYVSEFEIGTDWQNHSQANGSFLMIHCMKNYISASSFILGKLRGCTFLKYDTPADLPYLWTLYSNKLSWMQGIHDEIHVYGHYSRVVAEALTPYWDDSGEIQIMSSLDLMQVDADEKTYGFPLESVFPAIMMSLNLDDKVNQPA